MDAKTNRNLDRTLDAVGWGLFFIWTGVAILADVGLGVGLIGVGLIMLGTQVARRLMAGPGDPAPAKTDV